MDVDSEQGAFEGLAPGAPVRATVADLVARARGLAARGPRTLLGIVGAPGAGKSTLCTALAGTLPQRAVVVGMDGFHLADEVLRGLGRRERKGAPDTFDVAGYVALLDRLRRPTEGVVYAPLFDRSIEAAIAGAVPVPSDVPLVVTEGNYLLHDEHGWEAVRSRLDEVWYLDVPPEERVRRLVARRTGHGEDATTARAWVLGVDAPNGDVVDRGRAAADLVVQLVADPPAAPA
ncbi:nucleoside/nucleotide kinase family protein [Cellulomonas endophytica]|uniref:nucleoside/nucleotide kinase family protein n=1 Tax=Cellulomonas endophytica TaxID=2494735 RepID=UPI001F0CCD29|nr:nucleoside/nucleotide kinase family protein [Cellulomonas endophytica]